MKKLILISYLLISLILEAQTVNSWITTGNGSQKLNPQALTSFSQYSPNGINNIIDLDTSITYQTMDGFGFALTQGSAESLMDLDEQVRLAVLNELYGTSENAQSIVRISIGASDLSNSVYTYNETAGDINMNNFNISDQDSSYLIPVLQDILSINPNIKILATPWTAPTWMKTNNSWIGGSLDENYYSAYASYFIKYLDVMASLGINIWAITPQNEPEHDGNEPSMLMTASEQTDFINNHLGPAIANSSHNTKIIAFDHNCDNTAYPISVLNNSPYVDGAAFHMYLGDISAMSTVKNQTNKNVYFTEQYTSSKGNFGDDLSWHMQNIVIGAPRNWSKTVIEWNLSTNSDFGPRTAGGCSECLGAVTVTGNSSFTRNVSYYILSHISRFVQPGAVRIDSNTNSIHNVAFLNPDDTITLIAFNEGSNPDFKVRVGNNSFTFSLPQGAAATLTWNSNSTDNTPPVVNLSSPTNGASFNTNSNINIMANATDNDGSIAQVEFFEGANFLAVDTSSPYSFIWNNVSNGNYSITAKATDNEGLSITSSAVNITVNSPSTPIIANGTYNIYNPTLSEVMSVNTVAEGQPENPQNIIIGRARMQAFDVSNNLQEWTFTHQGNDIYKITNVGDNSTLGVKDGWCGDFGDVQVGFDNSSPYTLFKVIAGTSVNSYVFQIAFDSDCNFGSTNVPVKAFDIDGGNSGSKINTFPTDAGNANQEFQILALGTLSTNDSFLSDALSIYYNKNEGLIVNSKQSNIQKLTVNIYDLSGRSITSKEISSKGTIEINNVNNGVYFARVIDENNNSMVKKFIVF